MFLTGGKAEPWREDDKARPLQAYGVSKRAGELAALAAAPDRSFIVRTCGLYSHVWQPRSWRQLHREAAWRRRATGTKSRSVRTSSARPHLRTHLREAILALLTAAQPSPGIYHFTAEGACSWAEFAAEAFALSGVNCRVVAVDERATTAASGGPHIRSWPTFAAAHSASSCRTGKTIWRDTCKSSRARRRSSGAPL